MLVLDANILIRAVLGHRVRSLLVRYGATTEFFAPELAFEEAQEHPPAILVKRSLPIDELPQIFAPLRQIVQPIHADFYASFEQAARERLRRRDLEDWPILAAALALGCPIWTEDSDFFGAGVATWTTDRVELFLKAASL